MQEDLRLLEAWRDGDQDAGRELFERHFRGLRRFFHNKVDAGVEDLIQATLLRCLESRDKIRDPSRFRAYLYTVARHELFAALRQRTREPTPLDSAVTCVESLSRSPSRLLVKKREHRTLVRALRRIPIDYQIALELYYWEELRTADLGEILGLNASTVTTRLARARELLRDQVAALGDMHSNPGGTEAGLAKWAADIRDEIDQADFIEESK